MKKTILFLILGSGIAYSQNSLNSAPLNSSNLSQSGFSFLNKAIERNDNDIDIKLSLEGKKNDIPQKVKLLIQEEIKPESVNQQGGGNGPTKKDSSYLKNFGPVYLIKAPNGLAVYVLMDHTDMAYGGWSYGLILYDPKADQAGTKIEWISGKWFQGLSKDLKLFDKDQSLKKPLIAFQKNVFDDSSELVAEEYVHNGNTVSGAVYHYFFIGTDLSLKEVLELEVRSINEIDQDSWFVRKIVKRKKSELTIEVTLEKKGEKSVVVGSLLMKSNGAGSPFEIVNKILKNKQYKNFLYASDDDDYSR